MVVRMGAAELKYANGFVDRLFGEGLHAKRVALPADVKVLIVADRGFGDHKLYQVLTDDLKFDYLIRFRGNIKVTAADGETRAAVDWVGKGGRMRILRGA